MGFIGTMLVIIAAYWLGFFTAAMLSVAKRADEQAERINAKHVEQGAPFDEWQPPTNFCGEQAIEEGRK